jgi:hypothetical protein
MKGPLATNSAVLRPIPFTLTTPPNGDNITFDVTGCVEIHAGEPQPPAGAPSMRIRPILMSSAVALATAPAAAAQGDTPAVICLVPASTEMAGGNSAGAVQAARETFAGFLSGPSLTTRPLTARLTSQAREEAKAAGCPFVLFTSIKHERKKSGGGLFGKVAGGAVQQGAWSAAAASGSAVGRVAAGVAAGAAGAAASDLAGSVKTKDELTLTWRLESPDGRTLLGNSAKRKAGSDGEDLLTPLAEQASEAIAAAVTKQPT